MSPRPSSRRVSKFLSTPSSRRATRPTSCSNWASTRFLSTPSSRRATMVLSTVFSATRYFYPRPPRGGRPVEAAHHGVAVAISIHALLAEGDGFVPSSVLTVYLFLSTPSSRRATDVAEALFPEGLKISIHALLAEGDAKALGVHPTTISFLSTPSSRRATEYFKAITSRFFDFYPRPPRGGRPCNFLFAASRTKFLSTPSSRRATA